jgi:membrane-bound lytic murein transglycosylase D
VPKLIALAQLIKYPEKHGITLKPLANVPYFASVNTGGQIDLSQLAQISQTPLDEIYKLNPGFNRWATNPEGPHKVLIPINKKEIYLKNIANLPENQRMKWQRYKVKEGDSLIIIAKKFHTTPNALKDANNLRKNMIRTGEQLLIPSAYKSLDSYSYSAGSRLAKIQNSSKRSNNRDKIEYEVQGGDSFWEIARDHKVGIRELAKWNGMAPGDMLKQGQKLVIWGKKKLRKNREVIRKLTYTVRNGDSLARIADKFRVRIQDLIRWNRKESKSKYLQPGQKLKLYVDVTN